MIPVLYTAAFHSEELGDKNLLLFVRFGLGLVTSVAAATSLSWWMGMKRFESAGGSRRDFSRAGVFFACGLACSIPASVYVLKLLGFRPL
jgi:hypothetical protein